MDLEIVDKKQIRMIILAVILVLPACANYKPKAGAPWNQDLLSGSPPGPPKFQMGWKDGCETGISATGNLHHRQFYHYTQNGDLAQDHEYYTGWKIAYDHCQRHFYEYLGREYF